MARSKDKKQRKALQAKQVSSATHEKAVAKWASKQDVRDMDMFVRQCRRRGELIYS